MKRKIIIACGGAVATSTMAAMAKTNTRTVLPVP